MAAGVLRGGGERQPQPGRVQGGGEAHRVRERLEAALGDQPVDQRLLGRRVGRGARRGVGDAELLQRRARSLQPSAARHVGLVERRGEARRVGEAGERLAPRALVRRGHQHAVHIEDRRRQRHGGPTGAGGSER